MSTVDKIKTNKDIQLYKEQLSLNSDTQILRMFEKYIVSKQAITIYHRWDRERGKVIYGLSFPLGKGSTMKETEAESLRTLMITALAQNGI